MFGGKILPQMLLCSKVCTIVETDFSDLFRHLQMKDVDDVDLKISYLFDIFNGLVKRDKTNRIGIIFLASN